MAAIGEKWNPFESADAPVGDAEHDCSRERLAFIEDARNVDTAVRESVRDAIDSALPSRVARLVQAFLTWMSGCPHLGQQPLYRRTRVLCTVEAFAGFVLSIVLGYALLFAGAWYLLPIAWLLLVGRTWALFNIFHHATHGTLFESERLSRFLAFLSSIVSFSSSLDAYYEEHIRSHHTRAMCTYEDKEAPFMSLGFRPGFTAHYYRWRLTWLIVTPWTYLQYTRYRLWDWQITEPLRRRFAVWIFGAALVTISVLTGTVTEFLLAYVVPLFIFFNVTGLLGSFSEHHWGTLLSERPRDRLVLLQQSRFLLDEAPAADAPRRQRLARWLLWSLRVIFYHVPARVAVLPGDSINHDHHHRHPRTENWPESTYERFAHVVDGCKGFEEYPHVHAWSLGEAIHRVFARMESAPYNSALPVAKGEERMFQFLYCRVFRRPIRHDGM